MSPQSSIPKPKENFVSISSPSGEGGEKRTSKSRKSRNGEKFPLVLLQAKAVSPLEPEALKELKETFPLVLLQAKAVRVQTIKTL